MKEKEHPDINDTLRNEGPEAVRKRVNKAKRYGGAPDDQGNGHEQTQSNGKDEQHEQGYAERPMPKPRFPLVAFHDVKLGTKPVYLVKGVMPRTGIGVVWGPPKCGKSFWTFDLMMHVARGIAYRGHRVQQGPVVYCAFEGQEGFKARIEAYRREHGIDPTEPLPFFLSIQPARLVRDHKALIASIRAQLGAVLPVAVTIDTLNRSIDGSESKDEDMTAYLNAADAIHLAFECIVVIIHHCGVNDSRPRGHTSLTGTTVAQLAVRRGDDDRVLAEVEYMKDGPANARFASWLKVIDVGIDDDGDTITSCVIEPIEATADEPDALPGKKLKTKKDVVWEKSTLRRAMMAVLADVGRDIRPFPDGPLVRAVDQEIVRGEFYRRFPADGDAAAKMDTRRKAFKRDVQRAISENQIAAREFDKVMFLWFGQREPELPLGPRPPSASRFRVIEKCSPETVCLHCQQADGLVMRVKDTTQPGSQSETLHEACAEAWFEEAPKC